jgi:uncharacterized protein (TIGR02246 family)
MTVSSILSEVSQVIRAGNEKFMSHFRQADAAGLARLYTEQGQVLPPQSDFVIGRAAIEAFWQSVMGMGVKGARLETLETTACGETAYEVGKYTLLGEGGQTLDSGKYVVIWRQEAGQWKLHRDIFNSSLPAPDS